MSSLQMERALGWEEFKAYEEANPVSWFIDGLLTEASFNMCIGGPKSGKSTLMRQMAANVSTGEPFLGRATKQAEVLFISPDERNVSKIRQSFEAMGAGKGVYFHAKSVIPSELLPFLQREKDAHPNLELVILDTLVDVVNFDDLNDYAKTRRNLKPLVDFTKDNQLTTVCLHHTTKKEETTINKAMLGSTALASLSETTLYIPVDGNQRRFLLTQQREGEYLERTDLEYNPALQISTLGLSTSQKKEKKVIGRIDELDKTVIHFLSDNPGSTADQVKDGVNASKKDVLPVLNRLVEHGTFRREGKGVKGNPFKFGPHDWREEEAAA